MTSTRLQIPIDASRQWIQVCCCPVKVHAASAGWTKAFAILDD